MSYNPSPTPTLAQLDIHATDGTRLPTSLSYADDEKKTGLGEASSVLPPPASAENEVDASAARCEKGDDSMQEDEVEAIVGDPVAAAAADAGIYFPGDEGTLRAWLVVLGALHITCCTFGVTNSWGVLQNYYKTSLLQSSSESSISWIGSLQYCAIFLPAVVMGRLLDTGTFLLPFTISASLYTLSFFITAQCYQLWHFILVQGILLGLSAGVMFGPALAIVAHWFHLRRSLAYGVVACGSSIGGTAFPIMIRKLIPKIGFQWTMRILGFIILYCTSFAYFTLRPRLPPKNVKGGMFNLAAFKKPAFSAYVAGCFLVMMGLYTPLTYLDVDGSRHGLGEFASYLISIANACSLAGRLIPGFYADKVGPVNILIPFSFVSGVLVFAWPFCTTKAALIVFSIIMGISTGAFVSLFSPGVAQLGETADIGRRMGMLTTCLSIAALVGPPTSGAILALRGSFLDVAGYAGSVVFLGTGVMLYSRHCVLGKVWGKM